MATFLETQLKKTQKKIATYKKDMANQQKILAEVNRELADAFRLKKLATTTNVRDTLAEFIRDLRDEQEGCREDVKGYEQDLKTLAKNIEQIRAEMKRLR